MLNRIWMPCLAGLWLWLAGCGGPLGAAELADAPFTVETWSVEEGLPQSSVISMVQTQDGYLWLGTTKGLVRFDGNEFTVFNEFNTPGLNSDQIVFLFEDSHTNLWVGTDTAGVAMIHDGKVQTVAFGGAGHESRLVSASEDTNGVVWLYTADAQLARYDQGRLTQTKLFPGPAISRMMAADQSGSIWISESEAYVTSGRAAVFAFRTANFQPPSLPVDKTIPAGKVDYLMAGRRGGMWWLMDGKIQQWQGPVATGTLTEKGAYPWGDATVTAATEDADGNLIVGTQGQGVYWFTGDGNYRHILPGPDRASAIVLSLTLDHEGNLWVGTDGGGVMRVKRKLFLSPGNLSPLPAQSVVRDGNGGVWVAFNANGLDNWRTNAATHYGIGRGQNAWTVLVDHQQTVWAGTRGEGLFRLQNGAFQTAAGSGSLGLQIYALFEDARGQLWAGTQNGLGRWDNPGWKLFTTREGLPENTVRAIAADAAGNLWVGTESQGLARLKDGVVTAFPASENGPPGNDISTILVDRDGILWVGTAGHGLARFQNGQWTHFSTKNGLASNSISYIIEDDAGWLWLGSNAGLMRIPKSAGSLDLSLSRTFGRADGLPTRECSIGSQPAACRADDGRFWFPTARGVVAVNPADLKRDDQAPLVRIEKVLVDGQEQKTNALSSAWSSSVVVPAGSDELEIHYTGLHFSAPRAVRFRYQLEGYEAKLIEVGGQRVVRYSNLWPRHYRFHVTAANEDGVWNDTGSVLDITVLPEFWQTRTFLAGVIVFILAAVAGVVRYLSTQKLKREVALFKQQEALEKERSRIARDLHDQLGANLTQVALLSEMAKSDRDLPAEVESHADQILQTARETTHALDEIVWAVNPSNDTLEGLVNYAVKYAQEYLALAGLRYRAEVPAQLPDAALPPEVRHNVFLAFKEAVNNVVKHAQASEVWIRLECSPGQFVFEIADNGRGLAHLDPNRARTRNGLRNMRKRLEEIHGEFTMTPVPAGGTIVRLTAPLAKSPIP